MVFLSLSKEELLLIRLPLSMPGKPEKAEDEKSLPSMDDMPLSIEGMPLPLDMRSGKVSLIMRLNCESRPRMGLMEGERSRQERRPWRDSLREVLPLLPLPSLRQVSKWAPRLPQSPNEKPPMILSSSKKGWWRKV